MTAAPTLRAGKTAWHVQTSRRPGSSDDCLSELHYEAVGCVIIRSLPPNHFEVAPSLMSLHRSTVPAADVFADEAAAKTEARRRRDQGKLL